MTASQLSIVELVALRPGVYLGGAPDGRTYLLAAGASQFVGATGERLKAALEALAGTRVPRWQACQLLQDALADPASAGAGAELLERLAAGGWLAITVAVGGQARYTVVPRRPPPAPPPDEPCPELVLSRFAIIRRSPAGPVVESPLSWCDIQVHDPAVLAVLGHDRIGGTTPAAGLPTDLVSRLHRDLRWAAVAVPPDGSEDSGLRVRQWSPHELWFHDRSRGGCIGLDSAFGGTWWAARQRLRPPPARRQPFPGRPVALARPDLTRLRTTDPPLTAAIEDRTSVRRHDDARPLTAEQLGEFLYRCARNRRWSSEGGLEYVSRPYPSGGSGHELELYPVVRHVAGLSAGMYHYDPHEHRLEPVCGPGQSVTRLLGAAARAAETRAPQLLLVVAARFGRLMWKYEAMPYSLVLKHVGVLYHQMYLVATAMRLAPCALGAGDQAAFAVATGADPLEEASVGEFMLGSRAPAPGSEAK